MSNVNLTDGKIFKSITVFAIPCILSNLLQNLYAIIDSAISGRYIDSNALVAVGIAGCISSMIVSTVQGLMIGFSVSAAKAYGAGNMKKVKAVFINSFIITLVLSVILSVLGILTSKYMLILMKTPKEIFDIAQKYLNIVILGIFATMFYNLFGEMLRAIGNSRAPLVILFISSALHIAFIYLFVVYGKMGVVGAALSNVIAQIISSLLCFYFIKKKTPCYDISISELKCDFSVMKECLKLGLPLAAMNFIVQIGIILLQFVSNGLGKDYATGYSFGSKIGYILTTPLFGYATAVSVFAAQNLGAGNYKRIREGIRKTLIAILIINAAVTAFSFLFSEKILKYFISDNAPAVLSGMIYINVRCFSAFILAFPAVFKSVLSSLGKPLFPTVSSFLEVLMRFSVPIALSKFGFISVPLTDTLTWSALLIFFFFAYFIEIKKICKKM